MKCKQINGKEKIPMILPNNQNRTHQTAGGQQAIIIEYHLVENWNAMTDYKDNIQLLIIGPAQDSEGKLIEQMNDGFWFYSR